MWGRAVDECAVHRNNQARFSTVFCCLLPHRATEVINSSEENVSERVKAITNGEGAHSAVDAVSGDLTYELGESLHKGGQVYIYGAMEGLAFKGSVPAVLFK